MNDMNKAMIPISPEELGGFDVELGVSEDKFVIKFSRPMRMVVLNREEVNQLVNTMNLYLKTRQ